MSKRILVLTLVIGSLTSLMLLFTSRKDAVTEPEPAAAEEPAAHAVAYPDEEATPEYVDTVPLPIDEKADAPEVIARDRKVAAKLERFIERTAGITAESVMQERERLSEGLRHALNQKTPMPAIREDVDDSGHAWEELDYGNGVIRYSPAVLSETKL